jgi:hypothetical protein
MKKIKNLNGIVFILCAVVFVFLLSGCANSEPVTSCLKGHTFGFWGGLWHGIIAPIDLAIMLFRDDITVYAQNNNGIFYAFGFVIGSGGWGFLGNRAASKRK